MCQDMFGIDTTEVTMNVAKSYDFYGTPWSYTATNVVLPNGGYDPWSSLGCNVTRTDQHQMAPFTPGKF